MKGALLSAGLVLVLAGCTALPTPVVRPTGAPENSLTQTAAARPTRTHRPTRTAGPTETPAELASATPLPSATRLPLPSFTPTLPFAVMSATPSPTVPVPSLAATQFPPAELDCDLIWQSPRSVAHYNRGQKFSVGWNLRNIGTATWDPGGFQFVYLGGAKLATHDDVIPLAMSVAPGDEVVLSVPMKAPLTPSMYTTHWGIRRGSDYFCRLTLTIWVR